MSLKFPHKTVIALLAAVLGTSTVSFAGYTQIGASSYPGEKTIPEILGHTYGGTFSASGVDYVGSTYTAFRIQDTASLRGTAAPAPSKAVNLGRGTVVDGGDDMNPAATSNAVTTDQYWSANAVTAVAKARYAQYSQAFGYFDGSTNGSYHPILDVTGSEYNVSGSNIVTNFGPDLFRFARNGETGTLSSANVDNQSAIDHLVTYEIVANSTTAADATHRYMLFWEDKKPGDAPDYDYNDMAIEVIVTPNAIAVPEPISLAPLHSLV